MRGGGGGRERLVNKKNVCFRVLPFLVECKRARKERKTSTALWSFFASPIPPGRRHLLATTHGVCTTSANLLHLSSSMKRRGKGG